MLFRRNMPARRHKSNHKRLQIYWATVKLASMGNVINLITAVIGINRASQYSCATLTVNHLGLPRGVAGIPFLSQILSSVPKWRRSNSLAISHQSFPAPYLVINGKHCDFAEAQISKSQLNTIQSPALGYLQFQRAKARIGLMQQMSWAPSQTVFLSAARRCPAGCRTAVWQRHLHTALRMLSCFHTKYLPAIQVRRDIRGMFTTPLASCTPDLSSLRGWFVMSWAINTLTIWENTDTSESKS